MVQIGLSDTAVAAVITVIGGILGWGIKTIWYSIKDSKDIKGIGLNIGIVKNLLISTRNQEIKNIDTHTSEIHKCMLSEVIPGVKRLDNISDFVNEININTKNSGGDVKLIFSEVNKIITKVEILQKELEDEKRESRKREQNYMGQIAELRLENSKLKQRSRGVEYFQRKQGHKHDQEPEI